MKRVLFVLCFVITTNGLKADSVPFFPPLQPIGNNVAPITDYNNNITSAADPFAIAKDFNVAAVNRIEQSLFGRSFGNQNVASRLSRIEKSMFNATYPTAPATQRLDNIISNFNQLNKYPNISRNTLSKLESKVFSQTFPQNGTERRVERLEEQVFGAVQSGDMVARYKNLIAATKNFNADNVISSYFPTPARGPKLRNVLGNFGNTMMGGNMTGCTPPIDTYSGYGGNNTAAFNNSSFNSPFAGFGPGSGSGIYRGYGSNNGPFGYSYGESFNNYGSGAGVHILD